MSNRQAEYTLEPWEIEARLNRQRLAEALRDPNAKQCRRSLGAWHRPTGPVCLYGMALRIFATDFDKMMMPRGERGGGYDPYNGCLLERKLAISLESTNDLVDANDKGVSFPRLADAMLTMPYVNLNA